MKNILIALISFMLVSCGRQTNIEVDADEVDTDGIFANFQEVVLTDDFAALADEIHPNVLKTFRRRLEFSVKSPRKGPWFSANLEGLPTEEEFAKFDDNAFFVAYMNCGRDFLGNPFLETISAAEIITSTAGTEGYRHFVFKVEDTVAKPVVLSFTKVDGKWLLMGPSMIDNYANRLRASMGKIPESY